MLTPPQGIASDPTSETKDMLFALGSVACHTGEQGGALLVIIQSLARARLISMAEAKKLVELLSAELPEAQRRVMAQCISQRTARPIRLPVTSTRRP